MKKINSKILYAILTLSLISISANLFSNKNIQGIDWTYPYYSGAANFEKLFDWNISISDYEHVKNLSSTEYRLYKHKTTNDLINNTVNNYGYVLIALTSMTLFPQLGDLQGTILFQLIIHIITSLIILFLLKSIFQKIGFLLLYAANPLIIYFVTFPFYYFWMFLSSFVFVVLILRPEWRVYWVYLGTPLLLLSILIRPTTIFLALYFYYIANYYGYKSKLFLKLIPATLIFFAGVYFISSLSSGSPWHTLYIGIGAYPNDLGINGLGDDRGFNYFHDVNGVKINTDVISGNYNNPEIRNLYNETLRQHYLELLSSSPLLFVRNAVLNTLQVFSIGYIVDNMVLTWISTIIGIIVLILLIHTRQLIWALAALLSAISFSIYYPPIPAYNFAAYMLLALGITFGIERFFLRVTLVE